MEKRSESDELDDAATESANDKSKRRASRVSARVSTSAINAPQYSTTSVASQPIVHMTTSVNHREQHNKINV